MIWGLETRILDKESRIRISHQFGFGCYERLGLICSFSRFVKVLQLQAQVSMLRVLITELARTHTKAALRFFMDTQFLFQRVENSHCGYYALSFRVLFVKSAPIKLFYPKPGIPGVMDRTATFSARGLIPASSKFVLYRA